MLDVNVELLIPPTILPPWLRIAPPYEAPVATFSLNFIPSKPVIVPVL